MDAPSNDPAESLPSPAEPEDAAGSLEAAAARAVHVAERLLSEWDDLDPEQRAALAALAPTAPAGPAGTHQA
jgi:hypothetical protein